MRNFNEGVDQLVNTGLDGLATANKLYVMLCDQQESDVDPTMTFSSLTQTATTASFSKTSATSSSRTVDLGAFTWTETTPTTSRSVVILTKDTGASPKAIAIQNLSDGAAWNCVTLGPPIVDDLSFKVGYQGEA